MEQILTTCLELDQRAVQIYWHLHTHCPDPALKAFWLRMREEEIVHVQFWKQLLSLAKKGLLPNIFEKPDKINSQLSTILFKLTELLTRADCSSDLRQQLGCAYRLEFMLVNPILTNLFVYADTLKFEFPFKVEVLYDKHLSDFIEQLKPFALQFAEYDMLNETISTLLRREKELAQENLYDHLTGLMNRRSFFNSVMPIAHLSQRRNLDVAVLMADIDNFKRLNDTYGHLYGDKILRTVGEIFRTRLRQSDIAGRFGGEEFIVFFSQIDPEYIMQVARDIQRALLEQTKHDVPVTLSIGATHGLLHMPVYDDLMRMIKVADDRLYKVKHSGKNNVCMEG